MHDIRKVTVRNDASILSAVDVMEKGGVQIALVVDYDGILRGTVTDGDIRRAVLRGEDLQQPVSRIMSTRPFVVGPEDSREAVLALMKRNRIHQIPVVDHQGRLLGMEVLDDILDVPERENIVVLMAGGLGTRLRPLTDETPKPLLKVGDKPLLETILESFAESGFRRFYIAVNYRSDMVEAYFENGAQWGVNISYLKEDRFLGTAGALSLIPEQPRAPLILMNGDILTKVNFQQLLNFHLDHEADLTMCVRNYQMQIPFGVVQLDNQWVNVIEEKPTHQFFVNAGIYVVGPEALRHLPSNNRYDMPDLVSMLKSTGGRVAAFPIREYWLDIGQVEDFWRANSEFPTHFTAKQDNPDDD